MRHNIMVGAQVDGLDAVGLFGSKKRKAKREREKQEAAASEGLVYIGNIRVGDGWTTSAWSTDDYHGEFDDSPYGGAYP